LNRPIISVALDPSCRKWVQRALLRWKSSRAGGGIGRRAGFRILSPKGGGGSTPPSPTSLASGFSLKPTFARYEQGPEFLPGFYRWAAGGLPGGVQRPALGVTLSGTRVLARTSYLVVMRRSLWLTVAVALLLAACGDAPSVRDARSATEPAVFFPTQPDEPGALMQALYRGPLLVRDRCVFIGSPGNYSVPIWRKGFTASRDESGLLIVLDSEGAVVAVEGETFEMGGGYVAEFRPHGRVEPREDQIRRLKQSLGYPIPGRCLTPDVYGVWMVGET
jgi:hypothetical protein